MESQTFGHQPPLVFNQEVEIRFCSRCDEMLFGPGFSCSDSECEFSLDKECAEPPDYINHPLHRDHPLSLLPTAPYEGKAFICSFCGGKGENYVYHCSCGLALHIKCAFFTCNILEKNSGDFDYKEGFPIKNKCSVCWETILDSYYCCYRGWENLHKKCAELSFEIEYPLHRNRLLNLQFFVEKNPCVICHDTKRDGLCYACSLCNFSIHISCMSLPSVIQGNTNQHPFTLISRLMTFTCDACGVEGNTAPYMSNDRNLLVHKKCISLPPVIKFRWREHLLFHSYFIDRYHSSSSKSNKNWDCVMCLDEVNTNHGSYFCSECHFILHANCATKDKRMYYVIKSVEEFNTNQILPKTSYRVVERNEGRH